MTDTPVVLFLCTHNAGRSLAARVLLDHYAQGRVDVRSAGSEPADQLNPSVVAILRERGLDPARDFPNPLADETAQAADVIVTMGCGATGAYYPGKRYLDWYLERPRQQTSRRSPAHRRGRRPPGPILSRRPHQACEAMTAHVDVNLRTRIRAMQSDGWSQVANI